MNSQGFLGLRVLTLESRRAQEMGKLIANCGGQPVVAPSMREVPLESNAEALAFAAKLAKGEIDMVIFLTGVGTRTLARVVENAYPREKFVAALSRIPVVARGPKPVAALREMGVPVALAVPEPNTWRDLLHALDERKKALPLTGRRVAVQEYGAANPELIAGLAERGAAVTTVPVYQWMLPEDTGPLREAVLSLSRGEIDVVLLTSSVQLQHLFEIAADMGREEKVRQALARALIASIGPITSEELARHGLVADLEPTHPKMGFLVKEASERGAELLRRKRSSASV